MKFIKTTAGILFFSIIVLMGTSCKKDPAPPETVQSKILGKWKIQSIVENDYYSGSAHVTTHTGPADYADFRNDNKVYSYSMNMYDTSGYGIISDTKMWIYVNTDIYDIQALTGTQLKLYLKENYAGGEYLETTLNCSK